MSPRDTLLTLSEAVPGADPAARAQAIGKVAAGLFVAGALISIPVLRLLPPTELPESVNLLPAVPLLTALVLYLIPWSRLDPRWVHVIPPLAIAEIAFLVAAVGEPHGITLSWFYVLVAGATAYAVGSRVTLAAHLGLLALALMAPIAYVDPTRTAVVTVLLSLPTILVASTVTRLLVEGLAEGQRRLRQLAARDPLTGVGNYRTLHARLASEVARHGRHGGTFSLLLVDLDRFKEVNERRGHLAGDRLLQEVAQALGDAVRAEDAVARQGGDEFAIVAPAAGPEEAAALAARVNRALAELATDAGPLTATVASATCPEDGATPEALMAHADAELRELKSGRRGGEPRGSGSMPEPLGEV
ncbi:MAG TPA: GGDEF domain-containing protein [Thermoleophilaceae bacterium]|nr:GGDEF domain-containing protein [Thermoleophilaceae bacterium]